MIYDFELIFNNEEFFIEISKFQPKHDKNYFIIRKKLKVNILNEKRRIPLINNKKNKYILSLKSPTKKTVALEIILTFHLYLSLYQL